MHYIYYFYNVTNVDEVGGWAGAWVGGWGWQGEGGPTACTAIEHVQPRCPLRTASSPGSVTFKARASQTRTSPRTPGRHAPSTTHHPPSPSPPWFFPAANPHPPPFPPRPPALAACRSGLPAPRPPSSLRWGPLTCASASSATTSASQTSGRRWAVPRALLPPPAFVPARLPARPPACLCLPTYPPACLPRHARLPAYPPIPPTLLLAPPARPPTAGRLQLSVVESSICQCLLACPPTPPLARLLPPIYTCRLATTSTISRTSMRAGPARAAPSTTSSPSSTGAWVGRAGRLVCWSGSGAVYGRPTCAAGGRM